MTMRLAFIFLCVSSGVKGFLAPLRTHQRLARSSITWTRSTENPPEDLILPDLQLLRNDTVQSAQITAVNRNKGKFNLETALFCGGLAFDAYVEPPQNSSRWERGSQGFQVAFLSPSYTRNLYRGLVEVIIKRATGLPAEDSAAEKILTGDGADACLLVAAVEGRWKEDIELLKQQYHSGVWDLSGAAHVVQSSTAWASVDEKESKRSKKERGKAKPYHVKGGWGKGGEAVWPDPEPFYLYVQDPATVRLVFTLLDNDRIGRGDPIGSTYKQLSDLIPQSKLSQSDLVENLKKEMLEKVKAGQLDLLDEPSQIVLGAQTWQGTLPLTSKPRKKDKNGQILAGAAAGAAVAGPIGAAAGAFVGSMYEGQVQGKIELQLRYLPLPAGPSVADRKIYEVKGGMPGIDWGSLLSRYHSKSATETRVPDLELCFFVNHASTGATCSVYRSLAQKQIVVSFRGTCQPIDLITDASIVQEAWVEGEDVNEQLLPKVHAGFRSSLNSVSRRLKELLLATVAPGDSIADYDMLVTGHSLGGALATLFTADIAQYGIDAGRGLPQLDEGEPWWKAIASTFSGRNMEVESRDPPRPKSLRLYSFGSPRVGNNAFADLFEALQGEGFIDEAYRVVNGDDVVARLPRSVNALVFGQVGYEHCGPTVLISQPKNSVDLIDCDTPPLWIEGESDDNQCPVRDGVALASPMAEGSLLADLYSATKDSFDEKSPLSWDKVVSAASKVSERFKALSAADVASVVGIDKGYSQREMKIIQSLLEGKALAHHMEDEYYGGMGRASGFLARTGEEIQEL